MKQSGGNIFGGRGIPFHNNIQEWCATKHKCTNEKTH